MNRIPMSESSRSRIVQAMVLAVILLFVTVVRVRLLDLPLERDEGEYAYMGQLILQGAPPYAAAYNMKLPGTAAMYALAMTLFGQTTEGIHLGLLLVNVLSIILLFLLTKRLRDGTAGLIAAASYAALALAPSVLGFAAHATHFVVFFALGGALVLLSARRTGKKGFYGLSGLLFGLAFIMKQPGAFFLLFGGAMIVRDQYHAQPPRSRKEFLGSLASFIAGGAAPFLGVLLWVALSGTFDIFWFWTVRYAAAYGTEVPLSAMPSVLRSAISDVTATYGMLWGLACLGSIVMVLQRDRDDRKAFGLLFLFFSILTLFPGFYFRQHYFVTALPALSLAIAALAAWLNERCGRLFRAPVFRHTGTLLFLAALAAGLLPLSGYFFREDPAMLSRRIYDPNPFAASRDIAAYIGQRSTPQDRIAVFGSEPEIYFYARRPAATGFLYTYSLVEDQPYAPMMQREMIREIEASRPKFVVDVHVFFSWLPKAGREKGLYAWLEDFVRSGYRIVGVVDLLSPEETIIKWDDDARRYALRSPQYVLVYERGDDVPEK